MCIVIYLVKIFNFEWRKKIPIIFIEHAHMLIQMYQIRCAHTFFLISTKMLSLTIIQKEKLKRSSSNALDPVTALWQLGK